MRLNNYLNYTHTYRKDEKGRQEQKKKQKPRNKDGKTQRRDIQYIKEALPQKKRRNADRTSEVNYQDKEDDEKTMQKRRKRKFHLSFFHNH